MNQILNVMNLKKSYPSGGAVLRGVDLAVAAGESVAIVGASGSGKSTLLNIIGGLDRPDAGQIDFEGDDLLAFDEKKMAAVRRNRIGFVFQSHHLLPQCTALENALIPSLVKKGDDRTRGIELLTRVGLADRLSHRPGELSGGERQRVAVARALINRPKLLLADEPTGALNREGADALLDLLLELNREEGLALIMVTHSERLASRLDRVLKLENGTLV